MKTPIYQASPSSSFSASNKGKHSNLILIFGIGAGLLIIAIISVLIICSCAYRHGKSKAAPKEIGMHLNIRSLHFCASCLVYYVDGFFHTTNKIMD